MIKIGYARVSTEDQKLTIQLEAERVNDFETGGVRV
jgi:DNA invertase Pin-like site-specific DNA recombinase